MKVALFFVEKVFPDEQGKFILFEGTAEGRIETGMFCRIQLNRSLGMTVPISNVARLSNNKVRLRTDFEEQEDFEIVFLMNIGEETFEIHDSE